MGDPFDWLREPSADPRRRLQDLHDAQQAARGRDDYRPDNWARAWDAGLDGFIASQGDDDGGPFR